MSEDGAHDGVTADRALKTILGGQPPPTRDEGMTPDRMRDYLQSAPSEPTNYDECARIAGKVILAYLEMHPEDLDAPAESRFDWSIQAGEGDFRPDLTLPPLLEEGLYDRMKRTEPSSMEVLSRLGLTGFQWGWAVNAARYALHRPPVPNPAIVTIRVGKSEDAE